MPTKKIAWLAHGAILFLPLLPAAAVEFPAPVPGKPSAAIENGRLRLGNEVFSAEWRIDGNTLSLERFVNRLDGQAVSGVGEELLEIGAAIECRTNIVFFRKQRRVGGARHCGKPR